MASSTSTQPFTSSSAQNINSNPTQFPNPFPDIWANPAGCDTNDIAEIPGLNQPYCGIRLQWSTNSTANATRAMYECCPAGGAIFVSGGCNIYCLTLSENTDTVFDSLTANFTRADGNGDGMTASCLKHQTSVASTQHSLSKAATLMAAVLGICSLGGHIL